MIKLYFLGVVDVSGFSFSLLPLEIIVGVILVALAALWVLEKLTDLLGMGDSDDEPYED